VQNSSLSKLLRWDWNLEKFIATGTHNSGPPDHLERGLAAPAVKFEAEEDWGKEQWRKPLLASQEEKKWPREDHTNPFAQTERTGIVRVHQTSQDQAGAKVEPRRRATAPDRRAHAVSFRRRRDQHRFCGKTPSITDFWTNRGRRAAHLGPAVLTPARGLPSG